MIRASLFGQATSEVFANSLSEQGYWLWDNGITIEFNQQLISLAQSKYQQGEFRPARVGKGLHRHLAREIRKDEIYWINLWDLPVLSELQGLLMAIKEAARQELFLPVKRFEAHFSVYHPGSYYRAHVDRHKKLPSRVLSLVLYLNDLDEGEGGELVLYPKAGEPHLVRPKAGRLFVFDSRIRHEVRLTHQTRWAFTCWFRSDEILGIEGL